jgi:cytochrome c biogenesis protein CcmG/thiol:disulfide interchange protein DsbE
LTGPVGERAHRPGRRRFLPIAVGLVLALGLAIGLTVGVGSGPVRAPAFSLPRLGGGPAVSFPLPGGSRHTPVVLTFFASWCSPCHREVPMIARVADRERVAGTRVAFVGIDGNDDPASALAFTRKSGVSFVVGADADSTLAPKYALVGYPGTVFIDSTGTVAGTVRGPVSQATLERFLARLTHP